MNQSKLNPARLAEVAGRAIGRGTHKPDGGMCVMEAAAYVAGEPWGDAPQCVCPVVTKLMVSWNDALPSDAERDRLLKPLIPMIVGTRSTPVVEQRRSYMALDWLIRVYTPAWLDLSPELLPHAEALRGLEAIADLAGATAAGPVIRAARDEAYKARDAARSAAYGARDTAWAAAAASATASAGASATASAGAAAGAAAGASAGDAAWDAAWDATYAVWGAAGAAAWDAARGEAWDAAGACLAPTTAQLQISAVDLVSRMCAVHES